MPRLPSGSPLVALALLAALAVTPSGCESRTYSWRESTAPPAALSAPAAISMAAPTTTTAAAVSTARTRDEWIPSPPPPLTPGRASALAPPAPASSRQRASTPSPARAGTICGSIRGSSGASYSIVIVSGSPTCADVVSAAQIYRSSAKSGADNRAQAGLFTCGAAAIPGRALSASYVLCTANESSFRIGE